MTVPCLICGHARRWPAHEPGTASRPPPPGGWAAAGAAATTRIRARRRGWIWRGGRRLGRESAAAVLAVPVHELFAVRVESDGGLQLRAHRRRAGRLRSEERRVGKE